MRVEEETQKVEAVGSSEVVAPPATAEATKDGTEDTDQQKETQNPFAIVEKVADPPAEKGSTDRDKVLARVETEKRISLIKAWEENEKTIAENKAEKKLSAITSWENSKKAAVEAQLKKIEESLEKKKAEYAEKMKNKVALLHKEAEEKRAIAEATRGEELLKAEDMAAKYRAKGEAPKKLLGGYFSF